MLSYTRLLPAHAAREATLRSNFVYTSSITDMSGSSGEFPAPMFEPECVMVLNVTASVLPDTINITATSMGGNVVAVVRHPKPKSLAMEDLNRKIKRQAMNNGWITVLDGVRLLGKHSRVLKGTTSLWPSEKWKFHWARELVARKQILKTKVDPRICMLARYIAADP